ncbi:maltokinase [Sediminihabitans luteus]|uniref:Maltokinase n=1 Tax=Sediminihabitans luteus TaxID=1138585 RepID=A0A2M9CDT4_9CELL|nr:aminoglycoside phosphotransferase [Sediminihabitans luteus]PJJ70091.1 maltokinase [Sediminihabitans luteus]GIJ00125.1 hypothetical protein Slu03_25020 [Sediminihabitans luteus]
MDETPRVLGEAQRVPPPDDDLLALLDPWMRARRWYPVKGVDVAHVPWISFALPAPAPLRIELHLLRLVGDGVELVVQVPLILAPAGTAPDAADDPRVVGHLETPDGPVTVHDGATHPALWTAVLAASQWEDGAGGPEPDPDLTGGRALTVEQSNSSVLLPAVAGGTMLKVVRAVAIGPNPDVTIPRALAAHGWRGVPRPLAWLTATWAESDVPAEHDSVTGLGPDRTAHLAVLTEFVAGGRDGFDLACSYARQDQSFTELSADLGRVVADMHAALAGAFEPGPLLDAGWLVDDLRRRAAEAVAKAPVLSRRAAEIVGFLDAAEGRLARIDAPIRMQHVHGDLHLGQVLHSRDHGWKVLDFEGEPLRPVAERTRADLALRDVAGMVRSFDYAAAVGRPGDPTWDVRARDAFLEAYRVATGASDAEAEAAQTIVRILALDKALYEVVYESRNRPDWTWIPLDAVDRILSGRT